MCSDSTGNVIDLVKDHLPELQLSDEDRQKNLELLEQAKKVSDRFLTRRGRRSTTSLSESPTGTLRCYQSQSETKNHVLNGSENISLVISYYISYFENPFLTTGPSSGPSASSSTCAVAPQSGNEVFVSAAEHTETSNCSQTVSQVRKSDSISICSVAVGFAYLLACGHLTCSCRVRCSSFTNKLV